MRDRHPDGAYRGCRRAAGPSRGRYLAVLTSAIVGAGVVALGTGAAMPKFLDPAASAVHASTQLSAVGGDRATGDGRASRTVARKPVASTVDQAAPDIWLLPMRSYEVTSPFGKRWGRLHKGVDLRAREGTPFYAVAAGTVVLSRWHGGYGYNVAIDHGDGISSVYGHASKLIAREGQQVQAGDLIALVGDTGHSFGAHLHFEIRQDDVPIEPTAFLKKRGVDVLKHADAIENQPSSD